MEPRVFSTNNNEPSNGLFDNYDDASVEDMLKILQSQYATNETDISIQDEVNRLAPSDWEIR
jgi:hypothetical protein